MSKPSIAEILRGMPDGACLDSREDARNLAEAVCRHLHESGKVEAIAHALYGLPLCSDNEPERRKIAIVIRKHL
jgi:hypothetical protein